MKSITHVCLGIISLVSLIFFLGFSPNSHIKSYETHVLSEVYYITDPSGSKALTVGSDGTSLYVGNFSKAKSQEWRWVGSGGRFLQSVYNNKYVGWGASSSVQLYPSGDYHILEWVKSHSSANRYYIQKADSRSTHLYIDNSGNLKTGFTENLWKLEKKAALTSVSIAAVGDPRLMNIVDVSLLDERGRSVSKSQKFRNGRCTFSNIPEGCYTIRVVEPSAYGKADIPTWTTEQRNVCINRSTRSIRFSKRIAK